MRGIFVWLIAGVLSVTLNSTPILAETGQLGGVDDLKKNNVEQLKLIKNTLEDTNNTVNKMANKSMAGSLQKFNRALVTATEDLKRSVSAYEQKFTPEAQRLLLDQMSKTYGNIIASFQSIDTKFLNNAKDAFGNAITKGTKISKDNEKRAGDDAAFQRNLTAKKIQKLKEIQAKIKQKTSSQEDVVHAQRLIRDVNRLNQMTARAEKSKIFWKKIGQKFTIIEKKKSVQLASLQTSILAFNQLRADITGQKEAIDQMIILGQLNSLTTTEFENSVDGIMKVGDDLFAATDTAFENVFAGLSAEDEADSASGSAKPADTKNVESDLDNLLKQYQ